MHYRSIRFTRGVPVVLAGLGEAGVINDFNDWKAVADLPHGPSETII
jgi:hypothetical protein